MELFSVLRQMVAVRSQQDGANPTLGDFQLVVLGVVNELGDDAYGMRIRDEIQAILNRPVYMPQVYAALARLEELGLLASEANTAKSAGHRGRTRRYYRIGANGLQTLDEAIRHSFRIGRKEPSKHADISAASTA